MKLIEHITLIKQMEIINRLSFFREFSLSERQVLLESFSHLYLVQQGRAVFKQFDNDKRLYIVSLVNLLVKARLSITVNEVLVRELRSILSYLQSHQKRLLDYQM